MLELRPNCECCDRDLDPASPDVLICTYECTWCRDCAETILHGICPNCGGELVRRRHRPQGLSGQDAPRHLPADRRQASWSRGGVLAQVRRSPSLEVVPDPQPHRPIHRIIVKVGVTHRTSLLSSLGACFPPTARARQHDGELLPLSLPKMSFSRNAGTRDAIIDDQDALLQAGRTLMTCPYGVFGNHSGGPASRRSHLFPCHTDRCIMASHHCQKNCHPRTKGVTDINYLASLGSDSSEAHPGLRRYVQY
jgi:uncharacterized protein